MTKGVWGSHTSWPMCGRIETCASPCESGTPEFGIILVLVVDWDVPDVRTHGHITVNCSHTSCVCRLPTDIGDEENSHELVAVQGDDRDP